jgi:hypothetical protein
MFNLSPSQVYIVTDTLATTPSGDPKMFVSKCVAIPHLEMVVAHTGVADIGQRWTHYLQTNMLARDIDLLDAHVQPTLQQINAEIEAEFGQIAMSSTIYHLGYSLYRGCYIGFVYRSTNGYASELMEPGFRVKPAPEGAFSTPSSLEELVHLGIRLRAEQNAQPANERVHIGGEFVQTVLSDRCALISKVYRFGDFEPQWLAMNSALPPQDQSNSELKQNHRDVVATQ